ncbi:MAG: D-alanyl-D-alanine carboxypeptidase [Lachnospiraceae bacterium]|nr:D-alanyl-D-alanine carboxypeptidase [Lachnospiraceae bacterium]MBQ8189776.1 D-alanyl-D-alanine carboxypeptidase [Lachnospiraceae bacterium]
MKKIVAIWLSVQLAFMVLVTPVWAEEESGAAETTVLEVAAPSAVLMEASTGTIIYEKSATTPLKPASITKIMTMLLVFEALDSGQIHLEDQVITSAHAKSMGGSQVFLEEGEVQTVDTLMKCVAVSSGNDAAVALAEHVAGSEEAFVAAMNERATELGMTATHFEDCCGLSDADTHITSALDVAIMSRELINNHPEVYNYTKIWMEDITHTTSKGSTPFTLSSTNKLLKQYPYTTGLKTGSTSAAKYCLSATANKDGIDMIAVVMAAPDYKMRFLDAMKMLQYGFSISKIYTDTRQDDLQQADVIGGVEKQVNVIYEKQFTFLDVNGRDLNQITKEIRMHEEHYAPLVAGDVAGEAIYFLDGQKIGSVNILYEQDVKKARYGDYLKMIWRIYLL